ncbi:hypothetical protein [Pseudomonas sp. RL_105y_Pfl2_101]|uniref:hypothetical protein n=1 Tax=Pseudomonas sp. RL_105y_Pfl2_101 TaxID=3088708 RepID=UPI0030DDD0C0
MLNRNVQTEQQYMLSQITIFKTGQQKRASPEPEPVALSPQSKKLMQADLKRNASGF